VLVLAALAIAAGIVGAAIDRAVVRRDPVVVLTDTSFHPLSAALRDPTPDQRRALADNLKSELDLTPAQEDSVTAIMERRAGEYQQLRNTIRPLVVQLTTRIHTDIERVLTPEQRDRYRAIQQRKALRRGLVSDDSAPPSF
jgi:Spy/CpxP family protein refolding chaperone